MSALAAPLASPMGSTLKADALGTGVLVLATLDGKIIATLDGKTMGLKR